MIKHITIKGFTLTELMVAVVIVGVMSSLAIPRLTGSIEKTRAAEAVQNLEAVYRAQQAYNQENQTYSAVLTQLDITISPSAYFNAPAVNTADPIVSIARNDGSYTLRMSSAGTISCVPGGPTCGTLGF